MPAAPGPESSQAQHCKCTKQLELLIPSSQLVSFPKDDIAVLINNLGTQASGFRSDYGRLDLNFTLTAQKWPHFLFSFLFFQIAEESFAVCFNLLCNI